MSHCVLCETLLLDIDSQRQLNVFLKGEPPKICKKCIEGGLKCLVEREPGFFFVGHVFADISWFVYFVDGVIIEASCLDLKTYIAKYKDYFAESNLSTDNLILQYLQNLKVQWYSGIVQCSQDKGDHLSWVKIKYFDGDKEEVGIETIVEGLKNNIYQPLSNNPENKLNFVREYSIVRKKRKTFLIIPKSILQPQNNNHNYSLIGLEGKIFGSEESREKLRVLLNNDNLAKSQLQASITMNKFR